MGSEVPTSLDHISAQVLVMKQGLMYLSEAETKPGHAVERINDIVSTTNEFQYAGSKLLVFVHKFSSSICLSFAVCACL